MTNGQPSILLCDDDEIIRRLITAILGVDGFDIRHAADALEAIAAIDDRAPELLILDVNVPGGGGLAVLEHVRAQPAPVDRTPVLMVTGKTAAMHDGWAESIGADGVLLKPFALEELRTTVGELLARDA